MWSTAKRVFTSQCISIAVRTMLIIHELSQILSGIQQAAQTVLRVYLKRTCSRITTVSSILGVLNDYALYKSTHSLTWAWIHKTHPLHSHYTGKLLLASILVNICRILLDKVLLTTCPWRQHLAHSDWEEKHRSSPQMSFLHHHHSVKLSPHCLVLWARAM